MNDLTVTPGPMALKYAFFRECLDNGRYKVDTEAGIVYTRRKGEWREKAPIVLPSGYMQHSFYTGRRNGRGGKMIYLHHIVWMAAHGAIEEGQEIDHQDRNPRNCALSNLRAVTHHRNILYSRERERTPLNGFRTIRAAEIADIRRLHGEGLSQSAIARALDLGRCSVRYVVKKIEAGEALKYEGR